MRSMVFAACAVVALSTAAPAAPAEPAGAAPASAASAAAPPASAASPGTAPSAAPPSGAKIEDGGSGPGGAAKVTFDEYRNWRLAAMERRRSEIDVLLSGADLPAVRKTRLEETQAYYNWLAGLPEAERDRRFRERFERIDANHDGVIDAAERAAWRERQRAFYGGKKREAPQPAAH